MKYYNSNHNCENCNYSVDAVVYKYSTNEFGIILCYDCQEIFRPKLKLATPQARILFFALRKRGAPAQLEKHFGIGRIDIAIVREKINIEVDGTHHNTKVSQAITDLKRVSYSLQKGYHTIRIPNSLIEKELDQTADLIIDILNNNQKAAEKRA